MPRSFTEKEKERIRRKLLDTGRQMCSLYGLKKTSVEDLARETGISKGSFYSFFASKEDLVFELFEEEENRRDQLLDEIREEDPEKALDEFFSLMRRFIEENTLIQTIYRRGEFELLTRVLSPEQIQSNQDRDVDFARRLLQKWKEHGLTIQMDPEILAGLFRTLFLTILHKQEIGEHYDETIDFILCSISLNMSRYSHPKGE